MSKRNHYLIITFTILLTATILIFFTLSTIVRQWLSDHTLLTTNCAVAKIPRVVYVNLLFIQHHHRPPNDYKPLTAFANRATADYRSFINYPSGGLPTHSNDGKILTYQESDIYPFVTVINRGPERLIIGSDGKNYYTYDHYKHFIEITPECTKDFIHNAYTYK